MTTRDTFTTIADGDQLNEGYFNDIYNLLKIAPTVYTGTGFDASVSHSDNGASNTNNTTIQMPANTKYDYVMIVVNVGFSAYVGSDGNEAKASLKIEVDENGAGSFTEIFNKILTQTNGGGTAPNKMNSINLYYAPTAGEKANGLDIKITGTVSLNLSSGTYGNASISNIQTVIYTH